MTKYRTGKSGVPTRKIKEIKKEISAEKGEEKSDKDRIAALEKQLAILLAKTQQKQDRISDRDVERSLEDLRGDDIMPRAMPLAKPRTYRDKVFLMDTDKKGGGHVKNYTGGKSGDKYYGGGPVYPRPTKGN